jgi:hypothetical protein
VEDESVDVSYDISSNNHLSPRRLFEDEEEPVPVTIIQGNCHQAMRVLEDIMESQERQMNEQRYLELSNLLLGIHQACINNQ